MISESADPFDVEWESRRPVYRVYVWSQPDVIPTRSNRADIAWHCTSWRFTDVADVHEVLQWATRNSALHNQITIYVETIDNERLGLVRIAGTDPTDPAES